MEDILRRVLPPIILFLVMGLPFLIVVYKFDQVRIGRIKFAISTIVVVVIGLRGLLGLSGSSNDAMPVSAIEAWLTAFLFWIPFIVYAVLCGLRANDLRLKNMTKTFNALIPTLLFFAWPYFALAKGDYTRRADH